MSDAKGDKTGPAVFRLHPRRAHKGLFQGSSCQKTPSKMGSPTLRYCAKFRGRDKQPCLYLHLQRILRLLPPFCIQYPDPADAKTMDTTRVSRFRNSCNQAPVGLRIDQRQKKLEGPARFPFSFLERDEAPACGAVEKGKIWHVRDEQKSGKRRLCPGADW